MKDGSYSVYEVDPYKYISWKDGLLFFASNTLFEVLQKVAAFYKIEITCSGEIGSRKCTGKLILFDDLDGTLDVLSDIFRIAYVRGPDGLGGGETCPRRLPRCRISLTTNFLS